MNQSELAQLREQLNRLTEDAEALRRAVQQELKDLRRAVASSHYARVRRVAESADPAAGSLARSLRALRLPPAEPAAMPPPYGGPSHWPRAMAGRSQLKA